MRSRGPGIACGTPACRTPPCRTPPCRTPPCWTPPCRTPACRKPAGRTHGRVRSASPETQPTAAPHVTYEVAADRWWLHWPCGACGGFELPIRGGERFGDRGCSRGPVARASFDRACPGCETRRRRLETPREEPAVWYDTLISATGWCACRSTRAATRRCSRSRSAGSTRRPPWSTGAPPMLSIAPRSSTVSQASRERPRLLTPGSGPSPLTTDPAPRYIYDSRTISSAGRAPPRQGGGRWFEPSIVH
jgi:hypothetical protein